MFCSWSLPILFITYLGFIIYNSPRHNTLFLILTQSFIFINFIIHHRSYVNHNKVEVRLFTINYWLNEHYKLQQSIEIRIRLEMIKVSRKSKSYSYIIFKQYILYFFEYHPEMIHCFIFETYLIGAYFKYSNLVTKFLVCKKLGNKRSIQKILF